MHLQSQRSLNLGVNRALTLNILREIGDYRTELPYLAYLSDDGLCVMSLASIHFLGDNPMKYSLCQAVLSARPSVHLLPLPNPPRYLPV